jgi:hypothetical protein
LGRKTEKLDIARGMKKDQVPIDVILKYTGLNREEIEGL